MPRAWKYPFNSKLRLRSKTLSEVRAPNEGNVALVMLFRLRSSICSFFKLDNLSSPAKRNKVIILFVDVEEGHIEIK